MADDVELATGLAGVVGVDLRVDDPLLSFEGTGEDLAVRPADTWQGRSAVGLLMWAPGGVRLTAARADAVRRDRGCI